MIPGAPHPLMLAGGGDPIDEFGAITHSLRLRASAGGNLTTSLSGSDTTKWSLRLCLKPGALSVLRYFLYAGNGANLSSSISLTADDQLDVNMYSSGYVWRIVTSRKYRDVSAGYDILVAVNTNASTPSERVQIFVDGVRETSLAVAIYPDLAATCYINGSSFAHNIGQAHMDGLISAVAFIDGQALTPSAFGLFHPRTGQWRPKTKAAIRAAVAAGGGVRNGWGANGFFLPFEPNDFAAGVVYDRSQSDTDTTGNNWTLNNINVTTPGPTVDLLKDGTDNYATLNPLAKSNVAVSDGNLKIAAGAVTAGWGSSGATMVLTSGKWEFRAVVTAVNSGGLPGLLALIGVAPATAQLNSGATVAVGDAGFGWAAGLGTVQPGKRTGGSVTAIGSGAIAIGDVLRCAVDVDAGKVWFGRNENWFEGNPETGVGASFTGLTGPVVPMLSVYYETAPNASVVFDGGQGFTSYPSPAGFNSLCARSLPFPKIPNPATAFAAVTDSGANILAALAAARAGWPAYIDIVKRRDPTAEGWRWSFSDDPGWAMDSASGTAGRFAYPSLGGASYIGYSLKVSAYNGMATGRLAHVSGTADVVVDDLGNARKAVILVSETSGNWFYFHPDLPGGKLLYLNLPNGETTDASISAVLINSFTVAAALPTGIYRWIALAEVDGFLKLSKYPGNLNVEGPFSQQGLLTLFGAIKNTNGSTIGAGQSDFIVFDTAKSKSNPAAGTGCLYFNQAAGEGAYSGLNEAIDVNANGLKVRGAGQQTNGSSVTYVTLAIGHPFRYANAR